MGAEAEQQQAPSSPPPVVVGLQLSALIDHVAHVDWSLLDRVPGDRGGSQQVPFLPPTHHNSSTLAVCPRSVRFPPPVLPRTCA